MRRRRGGADALVGVWAVLTVSVPAAVWRARREWWRWALGGFLVFALVWTCVVMVGLL